MSKATVKFNAGNIVATPGALDTFDADFIKHCVGRHLTGDWGDVDAEDKAANDADMDGDGRLVSSYIDPKSTEKLLIITEWDRSVTTLLTASTDPMSDTVKLSAFQKNLLCQIAQSKVLKLKVTYRATRALEAAGLIARVDHEHYPTLGFFGYCYFQVTDAGHSEVRKILVEAVG
jgi:hypothetical protein